ncbi:MAG: hypothetical protein Q9212_001020 [Teloschistes hypoglaucus]
MDPATSHGIGLADTPSAAPPKGVQPDFTSPTTSETPIIAVSAITSALVITLLSIRLYSTIRITRTAWYDDIAIVVGTILSLAYSSMVIIKSGFARHGWDLPLSAYTADFSKTLLAEGILTALSIAVSKLCTLLLFYRLFGTTKRFRYCIYFGAVWVIVLTGTNVAATAVMCAPHSDESFGDAQVFERCSRLSVYSVVQGSLNVALDIYLLYVPVPVIRKLQLERKKKFGIAAIFMTGLM